MLPDFARLYDSKELEYYIESIVAHLQQPPAGLPTYILMGGLAQQLGIAGSRNPKEIARVLRLLGDGRDPNTGHECLMRNNNRTGKSLARIAAFAYGFNFSKRLSLATTMVPNARLGAALECATASLGNAILDDARIKVQVHGQPTHMAKTEDLLVVLIVEYCARSGDPHVNLHLLLFNLGALPKEHREHTQEESSQKGLGKMRAVDVLRIRSNLEKYQSDFEGVLNHALGMADVRTCYSRGRLDISDFPKFPKRFCKQRDAIHAATKLPGPIVNKATQLFRKTTAAAVIKRQTPKQFGDLHLQRLAWFDQLSLEELIELHDFVADHPMMWPHAAHAGAADPRNAVFGGLWSELVERERDRGPLMSPEEDNRTIRVKVSSILQSGESTDLARDLNHAFKTSAGSVYDSKSELPMLDFNHRMPDDARAERFARTWLMLRRCGVWVPPECRPPRPEAPPPPLPSPMAPSSHGPRQADLGKPGPTQPGPTLSANEFPREVFAYPHQPKDDDHDHD